MHMEVQTGRSVMDSRPGFSHKVVQNLSIVAIVLGVLSFCNGAAALILALSSTCQFRSYGYYNDDSSYRHYNGYGWPTTTTTTTTTTPYTAKCRYYRTYSSPGLWCGAMFIASGIIGIFAARRKTSCFIVALMVLAIVSTWTALCGMVVSIGSHFEKAYNQVNEYPAALHVLNSIVTLLSLVAFIIHWVEFGFTCRAVCCNGKKGYPKMKKWQSYSYQPLQTHLVEPPARQFGQPQQPSNHIAPVSGPEPVYLVQGHRIIGVLPQNLQQITQTQAQPGASQA